MEITGRLTADARVKTVSGERKVVNFSIAINDSYRSGGEQKKVTTFFDCAYWLNTGIAEYLKKGGLVQLYGRAGANAYIGSNGEAKASLTFHTSEVKLLGGTIGNTIDRGENAGTDFNKGKSNGSASSRGQQEKSAADKVDTFNGLDGDLPF